MYPPLKNKNSLDFENKKDLQKTFPINFIPSLAFLPFMKTFLGDFIASLRVLFFLYRDLLFCSYREKHANGKFSNDFPIIRRREDERSPQLFPLCKALPIYLSCFNSVVWRYISWYIVHMTLFMEWNETSNRISALCAERSSNNFPSPFASWDAFRSWRGHKLWHFYCATWAALWGIHLREQAFRKPIWDLAGYWGAEEKV